MKTALLLLTFLILTVVSTCGQPTVKTKNKQTVQYRTGLSGNNIIQYIQDKKDKTYFTDPIDDTINFNKIIDNIYKDKAEKYYILTVCFKPLSQDTFLYLEYFKDVTNFIDINSYKKIKNGYFANKGKIFYWWGNSDGEYPCEAVGADPKTFVPFDSVAGGFDKKHVFYGGPPDEFKIIKGADPKTIKVLNPKKGCWNCGNCYFLDNYTVYYGFLKIEGADPKTFRLLNQEKIDGEDKNWKYFEGKIIK